MAIIDTFKERLRESRRAKFRTAIDFARAIGDKQRTVETWEKPTLSSFPQTEKLPAICRALGVSADYLLGITDTPTPAATANTINGNGNIGTTTNNTTNANCRDCAAPSFLHCFCNEFGTAKTPPPTGKNHTTTARARQPPRLFRCPR